MGSEGVKTKHKAIMFPYLDKKSCGILQKKLNRRYTDLPQWLKNGYENIKCEMFSCDKCMRISRTRQYDIQVSNKVMWKCKSIQLKPYFILFYFILFFRWTSVQCSYYDWVDLTNELTRTCTCDAMHTKIYIEII